MQGPTIATRSNPLASAALAFSPRTWLAADLAGRLVGAFAVLLYAWQQYEDFDQYFGRTWAFVGAIALLAVVTAVPLSGIVAAIVRSAGAGALFFGGAMLASEPAGLVAMLGGALAWLAGSATAHNRAEGQAPALAGLAIGAAAAFGLALAIALTIAG